MTWKAAPPALAASVSLLVTVFATSCAGSQHTATQVTRNTDKSTTQPIRIHWTPALRINNLSDLSKRLEKPFGDVFSGTVAGKPVKISNCTEYLRLTHENFKDEDQQDWLVLRSDGAECVALNLLQQARPAARTNIADFKLNSDSLNTLPPELAPAVSDAQQRAAVAADKAGQSWKDYVPSAQATQGSSDYELNVRQPEQTANVTEYGRADFTGSGSEQTLLRVDYAAIQGTWGDSKLFILGRNRPSGRLEVVRSVQIP